MDNDKEYLTFSVIMKVEPSNKNKAEDRFGRDCRDTSQQQDGVGGLPLLCPDFKQVEYQIAIVR